MTDEQVIERLRFLDEAASDEVRGRSMWGLALDLIERLRSRDQPSESTPKAFADDGDAVDMAIVAMAKARRNHQAFLDGKRHVIRNLLLPPGQQEVFQAAGDYDQCHAAMTKELERIVMHAAVGAAIKQAKLAIFDEILQILERASSAGNVEQVVAGILNAVVEAKQHVLELDHKTENHHPSFVIAAAGL